MVRGASLRNLNSMRAPAATELLQGLDLLRDLNAGGKRTLPEHLPTGFVNARWPPYVFTADGLDRHFCELCALAELRDRLRAGDIWVTGSRQYRDFETYLIPAATFKAMQQEPLPLAIDTRFTSYMTERREMLKEKMTSVACKARDNALADVALANGDLLRRRPSLQCAAPGRERTRRAGIAKSRFSFSVFFIQSEQQIPPCSGVNNYQPPRAAKSCS